MQGKVKDRKLSSRKKNIIKKRLAIKRMDLIPIDKGTVRYLFTLGKTRRVFAQVFQ